MEEWSVLVKVARASGAPAIARTDVEAIVAALPGSDNGSTGGDGPDATFSCWVAGPDAATAISIAWRLIEDERRHLRLEPWQAVRTHSASAAQRLTGFNGVAARVHDDRAWSVLIKATCEPDTEPVGDDVRSQLLERLGPDASAAGGGETLVVRFWVAAADAAAADATARELLLDALKAFSPQSWTIVRAHHAVAAERAEETYRGAVERAQQAGSGGHR